MTLLSGAVPAILLAGGASRRLGRPKQMERLHGERLLDRAVRIAREAGCSPVVVVLGFAAEEIAAACSLAGTDVVVNPDWPSGMASSLRTGLEALPADVEGTVVMTCDQPAVDAGHLRKLMDTGVPAGCVVGSAYGGRRGVPAYFPADCFEALRRLRGDTGARDLLCSAEAIDLQGGELDVDTEETLELARQLQEGS